MVHTVGIAGINGNVGLPTVKLLAKAAEEGRIRLVILHRQGKAPSNIAASKAIELRVLDYEDPQEKIEQAVKGINFFISAVGLGGLGSEPKIVGALAKSPDIVSYMPSLYSITWTVEEASDSKFAPFLGFFHQALNRAKELKIGTTVLYVGAFEGHFLDQGFIGSSIKNNTVWASESHLRNNFPITLLEHVASAITHIATSDPESVKDREFSAVTYWPTGRNLVDLYTKLNGGRAATVKPYTEQDRAALLDDAPGLGPVKVGYFDRWDANKWGYDTKTVLDGFSGPSLEETARRFV